MLVLVPAPDSGVDEIDVVVVGFGGVDPTVEVLVGAGSRSSSSPSLSAGR